MIILPCCVDLGLELRVKAGNILANFEGIQKDCLGKSILGRGKCMNSGREVDSVCRAFLLVW